MIFGEEGGEKVMIKKKDEKGINGMSVNPKKTRSGIATMVWA